MNGIADGLGGLGLVGGAAAGCGAYAEIGALVLGGSIAMGVAGVGLLAYGGYQLYKEV